VRIVRWTAVRPSIGPEYHKGYIGSVHLYTVTMTNYGLHKYKLSSTIPGPPRLYGDTVAILQTAGEDRALELLARMEVKPL